MTPTKLIRMPSFARLKAVIALDPPRINSKPPNVFSLFHSSGGTSWRIKSTFASPATMQSIDFSAAMDPNAPHHARDDSVRAGIIRIQTCAQAQMIRKQLRKNHLERSTKRIWQLRSACRDGSIQIHGVHSLRNKADGVTQAFRPQLGE